MLTCRGSTRFGKPTLRFLRKRAIIRETHRKTMIFADEIEQFASFQDVLNERQKDVYANSPFRFVKALSSSKKGKFFEKIVTEYLKRQGFKVGRADSSEYDRKINGKIRLEIKGSSLWEGGTQFRWAQIRPKQSYDVICFLAMHPDRIELLGAPKSVVDEVVLERDSEGNWLHNQHGGKKVDSGTFMLQGFPQDFPWMCPLEEILGEVR